MENSIRVEIVNNALVKPASPAPQPLLLLSPCDVLLRDYTYNRRLLFYQRPGSDADYALFISTLESSLSQVLAFFYPFAGRLVEGEDGQLAVACNDEGAELVQAYIHGASFDDLQKLNFEMQAYYVHLTRWASYSRLRHEGSAPLLSIQVTRFSCGNIALGISHSHVIADGYSLWHFMSSWAECARGEPLSIHPLHDRTPLIIPNPSLEDAKIEFFEDANNFDEGGGKSKNAKIECFEDANNFDEGVGNSKNVRQKAFAFSKKMVETLKKRGNNEFGSYEVLCAHIWKRVSKARGHGRDVRISFGNVVNMRDRMNPPLTRGYFGNALLWGMASTTMGELEDEDLATTASRIRMAISLCSHSRMEQLISFLQLHGGNAFMPKVKVNEVRLRVSSSPKFPVLATNFGWGAPLAVRSSVVEENGKIVFYPGPSGIGSADICIALPCDAMERLENDPSFL